MGRFYLDLEFTNGNYYLCDIIEIALLAADSGNTFHSYVKIHYSIPARVKELTNITDGLLTSAGCSFRDTMIALLEFIRRERQESLDDTPPTIIAHSGYLFDFPILLANCMKHNFKDFDLLHDCLFVDSVHIFKNSGYKRCGLDSLCQELGLMRTSHSAAKDVHLLERVFSNQTIAESYSFPDLVDFLQQKLPVPIHRVYAWARRCHSVSDLEMMLVRFVRGKTALSEKQMFKVAHWYFKDRFILCR